MGSSDGEGLSQLYLDIFIENRDSNSTFILFYLNLTIWFSCLKTWVDVSWVGAYLWDFFQLLKRKINDKGGIYVRRHVTLGGSCDHS